MKCPHCGRDLRPEESFCPGCGWRPEQSPAGQPPEAPQTPEKPPESPRPGPGRIIRAVGAVLLYVMLLFGCQSCVMSGYMASLMMGEGTPVVSTPEQAAETAAHLMERTSEKIVLILLISNLTAILLICLLFRLRKRSPRQEMGVEPVNVLRLPTFALFGVALNIVVSVTLSFLPLPPEILEAFEGQYAGMYGGHLLLEICSVAVVAPMAEELVFRGLGMTRLRPVFGTAGAVILSAIVFGLAHGTPVAVVYAALLGLLLGGMYAAFDSVVPGLICHIFFNLTSYWLGSLTDGKPLLLMILYGAGIALVFWCAYRIFIRRPTFNDILADTRNRIRPINDEEARIIRRVRELQQTPPADLDGQMDEIGHLAEQFTENRRQARRERKNRR